MKSILESRRWMIILTIPILLTLHPWFSISYAEGKKPYIESVAVELNSENLVVSANLKNGLSRGIIEAINSGLTTTFNFHLELKSQVSFWFDMTVVSRTIKHTVKFNPILKDYTFISHDDKGENSKASLDFNIITQWMQNLSNIHLVPLSLLEPGNRYYIRVKAQMESSSLLVPLTRLLFFVSFGNFETGWVSSRPFIIKTSPSSN